MKNQIIIALAFLISTFSFAQKKELRAVEKSIKNNNYSEAKATLKQLESILPSMDDKLKSEYYFLKGQAFYANGAGSNEDIKMALENLDKVGGAYTAEVAELKKNMVNNLLTKGNAAYEKKDFSSSSKYFEEAYRASTKDTLYLYYAASTAVNVQEYDRALGLYEELKKLGYTGKEKQYFATNVENNKEELFDNKNLRDISVKAKTYINPTERFTESKKAEIVKNIALIYVNKDDNEKALAAMKDARAESPDDINLILSEANVYYKMGNTEEFRKLLELATTKDPKNPELQYNLGVISADSDHPDEARSYYQKTIELDPNYINAYINLAALILNSEQPIIEEMNSLGTSKADNIKYDELKDKRQKLYSDAIPYLEKAIDIDSKNINAAKTLMNIYSATGDTVKFKALKAKVEALESEN